MTAYLYITFSLILYPILSKFVLQKTKSHNSTRKVVLWLFSILSMLTVVCIVYNISTISFAANWFLCSLIYFAVSALLWYIQLLSSLINKIGKLLLWFIFGIGYLIAIPGCFFLYLFISEQLPEQRIWLSHKVLYEERNIGFGPDPSIRLKEISIYKTIDYLPFLVAKKRIRVYDEWNFSLQKNLEVLYNRKSQVITLKSTINRSETIKWSDSLSLNSKK